MNERFEVTGMTCAACSARVEKAVRKLEGVSSVTVNLLTGSMQTDYNEDITSADKIIAAVEAAGYGASLRNAEKEKTVDKEVAVDEMKEMLHRFVVSLCFLVPLMYVSMGSMFGAPLPAFLVGTQNAVSFALVQFLLCLPILYMNRKYFQVGFKTLFHGAPNMDSLIAVGSGAALVYGIFAMFRMSWGLGAGDMELVHKYHMDLYFESSAMILTLITLGKYLETRSKRKTGDAIRKMIELRPDTATIVRDGAEIQVPVERVAVGDLVVVKPGGSIPVDGVVVEGASAVDESAITGESIPVEKTPGDNVVAATINRSGYLKFRAERVGDDTTLAQMIRLVEDASAGKAPIARLADKIAGIFVPTVMIIALAAAIIWLAVGATFEFALGTGISVLVISCPCALGLATPVAIMVGTGKGAENGILIKSGEALETAHDIDTMVLDKTGTITEGKPRVTQIIALQGSEIEVLRIAAALEKPSEHPLAEAVIERAGDMELPVVEEFESVAGKGVRGKVDGKLCFAGNVKFMTELGVDTSKISDELERISDDGATPLLFAKENELIGVIAAADTVRETSRQAIEELNKMGVATVMLTGDNERTAGAIAKKMGMERVIAGVLPAEKERHVTELKASGKKVAMVGDGVNDAPALAAADVGIAIGAGTDVAIESADVVLIRSDLRDAVTAIRLSRAVLRNIKQNLFWAFFYNCLGIPLAAGVFFELFGVRLSPMIGAAAMSLSSVCVVSNALRLRFFKARVDEDKTEIKGEKNMIVMKIEGMSCGHCTGAVAKALNAIEGVNATVSLEDAAAYVEAVGVDKETLKKAVEDAGYKVVSIEG